MRYYVILPDGRKFGPADEPLLLQWMQEGRITRELDRAIGEARRKTCHNVILIRGI